MGYIFLFFIIARIILEFIPDAEDIENAIILKRLNAEIDQFANNA